MNIYIWTQVGYGVIMGRGGMGRTGNWRGARGSGGAETEHLPIGGGVLGRGAFGRMLLGASGRLCPWGVYTC